MKWSLPIIFGGAQITVHLNPLCQTWQNPFTETIYCTSVDVDWWYGSWDTEHHLFHSAFYILFQDKAPPWIRIIWISYIMKNSHALILGNKYLKAYNTLLFFAIISCRTWVCCRGQNAFNLLKTVSICKTWDQKAANVFRVVSVRGGEGVKTSLYLLRSLVSIYRRALCNSA